ncbi:NADH-quinone oxidoreductase subunit C [uncultured Cellulomonas sp.]|uniref:NADH-quinone oxidoreductase subunit C n=1 Tax=uncultured Cellulomonas sp. TaxID=189682 RepID=UPI00262D073B|nr:NADH-quinone oxidoreductase subunit C [uncultured Cellulomonas sp.]
MTTGPDDKGPLDAVAAPAETPPAPIRTDASPVERDAVVHADVERAQQGQAPPGPDQGGREPIEVIDVRTGMFGAADGGDTSGYGGLVRRIAMPGASERPYGGWFDEAVDVLTEVLDEDGPGFAAAVERVVVDRGELTLHVAARHLLAVCRTLRDDPDLRFELSMGVSGVHYPHETGRELHAVIHLVSVTHSRRLRLEIAVPDAHPHLPSTTSVYPTHDWHERETWDFFGIVFDGHPALARIEMPDDWPGHPQRKDYPLGGIPVEYKGATVPPVDQRKAYS